MPGLERRLRAELSGDVKFDRFTRGLDKTLDWARKEGLV